MARIHRWPRVGFGVRTKARNRCPLPDRCRGHPIGSNSSTNHGHSSTGSSRGHHNRERPRTDHRAATPDRRDQGISLRRRSRRTHPTRSRNNSDRHRRQLRSTRQRCIRSHHVVHRRDRSGIVPMQMAMPMRNRAAGQEKDESSSPAFPFIRSHG